MLLLGQKPLCCFDVELIIGFSTFSTQDQLELSKRETSGLYESKRQLQLKLKTLQSCLKTEKDEVKLRDKYIYIYIRVLNTTILWCLLLFDTHDSLFFAFCTGSETPECDC